MMTYTLMVIVGLFLVFELVWKSKYTTDNGHLFDKQNSNAMRGFWCLIVILVHIPTIYQNHIQDMLGSFAYIGVTFFFMTSAYGLKLGLIRNPESINQFWRKRLPRLLIPMFFVNIVSILFGLVKHINISLWTLVNINGWVQWLLVCYVIFWIVNFRGGVYRDIIICILIIVFSMTVYFMKGHISSTTWCPEIFGFVWGIVFFNIKDKFAEWTEKYWFMKSCIFCVFAGIVGIAYLKFKPIVFFGDYLLKIILGALIIIFMLVLNSHVIIGNKVSLFLGEISYEVYLLHGSIFALISYLFPEINSGCFIVSSIVLTVLISYVVSLCGKWLLARLIEIR